MKIFLLPGGLALTLLLAACSDCASLVKAPASPSPAPVAPQASAPAPAQLNGVARYFGTPFPGATIKAYMVGQNQVLATSTSGPDGKFLLTFPDSVPAGALLKLVATGNGRTVASLARLSERTLQQATVEEIEYIIDEERSTVLLMLGPRLEALGQLALGTDGTVALAVTRDAFGAFKEALAAVSGAKLASKEAFEKAGTASFTDDGHFTPKSDLVTALAAQVPSTLAQVLVQQADKLAVLIRTEVAAGKPAPDSTLTDRLPVSNNQTASQVFSQPSSGGGGRTPSWSANGTLTVEDGDLADTTDTPSAIYSPAPTPTPLP